MFDIQKFYTVPTKRTSVIFASLRIDIANICIQNELIGFHNTGCLLRGTN